MEHWNRNGTAEGKIFAHLVDHFRNGTVFWFCCFWQHTASRRFTVLRDILPRLLQAFLRVNRLKKKEMRCECGARRSSLDLLRELVVNQKHWLWDPMRFRKSKLHRGIDPSHSKRAPYKLPVWGGRLRRPCVLITARKKREHPLLKFKFFISLLMWRSIVTE